MSGLGGDPPCWAHLLDGEEDAAVLPAGAFFADLGCVTMRGNGAVWNLPHGGDLDANLVRLEPDDDIGEHVNDELDVLLFVQSGTGHVRLGDATLQVAPEHIVLVPRGARRSIAAGPAGLTYLAVHRRRDPLDIGGSRTGDR